MDNNNGAREAAQAAISYFNQFYAGHGFTNVRLEEVDKEGSNWLITLGYDDPSSGMGILDRRREYK
ncbi:hypothetical protein E4V51_08720, partial [Paenibacillus sp. 28ISP30-2]|nr:hypothetical protein [Paenibacillus sp. 28ISP30-2]